MATGLFTVKFRAGNSVVSNKYYLHSLIKIQLIMPIAILLTSRRWIRRKPSHKFDKITAKLGGNTRGDRACLCERESADWLQTLARVSRKTKNKPSCRGSRGCWLCGYLQLPAGFLSLLYTLWSNQNANRHLA